MSNDVGIDGYTPTITPEGISLPPTLGEAGPGVYERQRSEAQEEVYGNESFSSGRWECRVASDRIVLDLPVVNCSHSSNLVLLIGLLAIVGIGAALLPWAVRMNEWETVAGLLFCMSLPLLGATTSLYQLIRRRNREVIIEPGRLLLGKGGSEAGQFDEEALLVDSHACVSRRGHLQIAVGQREITLCATLDVPNAERIRDDINGLLEKHQTERPVYAERPGPSEEEFDCQVEEDRLTLTLPRLTFDWLIVRFVGIAYATALLIWGLHEGVAPGNVPNEKPEALFFVGIFGAVVFYAFLAALRDRLTTVRVAIEPSRAIIMRELLGWQTQRELPLNAHSRAELKIRGMGTSLHHAVEISPAGKASRFGRLMGYEDQKWIAERINEHLRRSRAHSPE